ncbi:MAG: OmpH family outer membrane protein [Bacteroidia bacterium]|nr:OmpH family outer membrane protein [Bacteroidia bacterium]
MNLKTVLMACVLGLGLITSASAQELKIGYANIEGLIAYMPATKSMNQELATYEKKLAEGLQPRQTMLQQLYAEYQEMVQKFQSGDKTITESQIQAKQEEIVGLEKTLQTKTQEAQQKLVTKRQDLMEPILDQVRGELEKLANEQKYTYIFNAVDGAGTSIILHGPEGDNVTKELAKRLGIELPDEGK